MYIVHMGPYNIIGEYGPIWGAWMGPMDLGVGPVAENSGGGWRQQATEHGKDKLLEMFEAEDDEDDVALDELEAIEGNGSTPTLRHRDTN